MNSFCHLRYSQCLQSKHESFFKRLRGKTCCCTCIGHCSKSIYHVRETKLHRSSSVWCEAYKLCIGCSTPASSQQCSEYAALNPARSCTGATGHIPKVFQSSFRFSPGNVSEVLSHGKRFCLWLIPFRLVERKPSTAEKRHLLSWS